MSFNKKHLSENVFHIKGFWNKYNDNSNNYHSFHLKKELQWNNCNK